MHVALLNLEAAWASVLEGARWGWTVLRAHAELAVLLLIWVRLGSLARAAERTITRLDQLRMLGGDTTRLH